MRLLRQIAFIARAEGRFFVRFPKLLLATLAVAVMPSVYAVIYLSSVWDPAAHAGALPVALVNLDEGVEYREHVFNAGWDVAASLRRKKTFGFQDIADPQEARRLVREGAVAFALIIPKDFSSNAIPGWEAGGGRLVVFTSEGNNFETARIARVFAQELGHEVNATLNERRWRLVLSNAAGSQRSVDRLRAGVDELRSGAHELSGGAKQAAKGAYAAATGSDRLYDGVTQLTGGVKQLASGLRTMDARHPSASELTRLKTGADELAAAHVELGKGLAELKSGSGQLREGVQTFRSEAKSSLLVPSSVVDGLDQVLDGTTQLDSGLLASVNAQHRMAAGASQLSAGVDTLTSGMLAMNSGVRTMVVKLPQDRQLDELDTGASAVASGTAVLADGTQKIKAGVDRLTTGLDLLADSLPSSVDGPDGSAQGLANSVKPVLEVEAPVSNSGSGFAPNVLPAALWLGAGIAAFLIHVRVLPRHAQFFSRPAQTLGKLAIPAAIVLSQATILLATVMLILKIPIVHPVAFSLTLGATALTFLAIVFALTRAFGDAGKALAMIFLAVQLSSSGGVLPVELSGGVFANISPWLPLTWVVRAVKASMFGAYGGAWGHPLLIVTLGGVLSLLCASYVGRWRFVRASQVRPAVDF